MNEDLDKRLKDIETVPLALWNNEPNPEAQKIIEKLKRRLE